MKRRSVLVGIGATAVTALSGQWRRQQTATSTAPLDALHPVMIARVIGTLENWYHREFGRYGTLTELLTSELGTGAFGQHPVHRLAQPGRSDSFSVEMALTPSRDLRTYGLIVRDLSSRHSFYINERSVIYKGALEQNNQGGRFVGRPIRRSDLVPVGWSARMRELLEVVVPTVHARSSHDCCCCKTTCDDRCPNVNFGCASSCQDCAPAYCCVQGFQDCVACCAATAGYCDCVWGNPYCDGSGGGCPI